MKILKLCFGIIALAIIFVWLFFPFYFQNIFKMIPAWEGAMSVTEMHWGDQLQQYYLSWVQHQNLKHGWSIFRDPYLFATQYTTFLDLEITPLYFLTAALGFLLPFHVAFNISNTFLPLILVGVFTYLFLALFSRYRVLALMGAVLAMLYPYRLEYQLLGHHAGAYAFFIPLLLWLLEKTRQSKLGIGGVLILIFLFPLAAISELHVGYYCVLLSGLWLAIRACFIAIQGGIKSSGQFLIRFYPVAIGVGLSGMFGWIVKRLVLQASGTLPVRAISEVAAYSFPVFSTFMNPQTIYAYPVFLLLGLLPLLVGLGYVLIQAKRFYQIEFQEHRISVLSYFLLTLFFVMAASGVSGSEKLYLFLYEALPGFSMQRVPHKMAYVAYPLWCLMSVFIWDSVFRLARDRDIGDQRRWVFRGAGIFFILVVGLQFYKIQRVLPTFPLHNPTSDEFSELHQTIRSLVPTSDIIVRLPLENGQYAQDGYAFFHILKTERRFFNGYHGSPPQYYLEVQDDFSKIYDGSASPLSFQWAIERGIRWLLVDQSVSPEISQQVVAVYKQMPFLSLIFQDSRHVLFYLNRSLNQKDILLWNEKKPSPYLEGWSALSSLAGCPGHWMKQEIKDETRGVVSMYAHRLPVPLSQDYVATIRYRTVVPLSVWVIMDKNKISLDKAIHQDLTAEILLPKGMRSPVIQFAAEEPFIPSKQGHSDPNYYGYFIQSIELQPVAVANSHQGL